jgi:hypothetical protein
MFQASLGSGFGAHEYGLHASIRAAVAYDELCSLYMIEITFAPQAIIICWPRPTSWRQSELRNRSWKFAAAFLSGIGHSG